MDPLKHRLLATALAALFCLGSASVSFGQNLVQNGNFSSMTPTSASGSGVNIPGGYSSGVTLTNWSNLGYTFVFTGTNKGDTVVTGSGGALSLWGPANGSANGLTRAPGNTNTLGSDGVYQQGPISQSISGFLVGRVYQVTFDWAGAQQQGYSGATTEGWSVALGGSGYNSSTNTLGSAQNTTMVANLDHGFTGWMSQTFSFTAASSTQTLWFLAQGTPSGLPPFSLLANVTVVPEASTYWTIVLGMLIMVGTRVWRGYRKNPVANP